MSSHRRSTRITKKGSGFLGAGRSVRGSSLERAARLARRVVCHGATVMANWPARLPLKAGASFWLSRCQSRSPVAGPLAAGRRPALWVVYFHHRHQELLLGAASAVWAVCNRTWSSCTSRLLASSSSPWAWTWVWSVVTRTCRLLSWLFNGWSFGSSSTSQRYPWGVGFWWAVSSPLPMRRRIVSVDTPKRLAASPTDTFSTAFLSLGMGNSIGVCPGVCVGAAQAGIGSSPW